MIEEEKHQGNNTKELKEKWSAHPNCRMEGVVYKIDCKTCLAQQQQHNNPQQGPQHSLYTEETSRSAFHRMKDHNTALNNGDTNSPLVVHAVSVHNGEKPKFLMRITSIEGNALQRIVTEAVYIACKPATTLNLDRKNEWGLIPRLQTTGKWGAQDTTNKVTDNTNRENWTRETLNQIEMGAEKTQMKNSRRNCKHNNTGQQPRCTGGRHIATTTKEKTENYRRKKLFNNKITFQSTDIRFHQTTAPPTPQPCAHRTNNT